VSSYMIWHIYTQNLEKRCTFKTPTSGENMGSEDRYNDELNVEFQWKIPRSDREEWHKEESRSVIIIDTDRLEG